MLFTEIIFIPFLLVTFIAFVLARHSRLLQLCVLLIASYVFYGWWRFELLFLIVYSSVLDFFVGRAIHRSNIQSVRKRWLAVSLIGNLGLLCYFKYTNFFLSSLQQSLQVLGLPAEIPALNIILPVGISFYTFQSLSYTFDIYRREIEPTDSLLEFLVFVSSFPQLVAGPIVRAREFLPQLKTNMYERSDESGVFYIMYGVMKKLFVADMLGHYCVDPLFTDPQSFSRLDLLFGTYCYAFQIFFDFSAYSDIAIGLGKIFGLQLPVNFRSPYLARGPQEFWQRWHITLSTWFRDYLYIPLGGNRGSQSRTLFNLTVVMLLAGFWHGANYTFVVWGALHGVLLVAYRLTKNVHQRLPGWVNALIFFHWVCLGWVFFRAQSLTDAWLYLQGSNTNGWMFTQHSLLQVLCILVPLIVIHHAIEPRLESIAKRFTRWHWSLRGAAMYVMLAVIAVMGELDLTHQAFIYFQF